MFLISVTEVERPNLNVMIPSSRSPDKRSERKRKASHFLVSLTGTLICRLQVHSPCCFCCCTPVLVREPSFFRVLMLTEDQGLPEIFNALITTLKLWGIQARGESIYRDPSLSSVKSVIVTLSGLDHVSQASLLLIYSSFHFFSLEDPYSSKRTRADAEIMLKKKHVPHWTLSLL